MTGSYLEITPKSLTAHPKRVKTDVNNVECEYNICKWYVLYIACLGIYVERDNRWIFFFGTNKDRYVTRRMLWSNAILMHGLAAVTGMVLTCMTLVLCHLAAWVQWEIVRFAAFS